jgi:hypothetical protein
VVLIDEQTGGGGGGSSWFDGAGTPSSGLGVNGDYYLNTTNGDVYEKAGGTWTLVGNIKGPAGTNGTNGVGVPVAGTTGQILAKIDATDYNTEWIDNFTSQVKHEVKAGVALTKGQAVYVTGATGTNMVVGKADNSTEATSSKTMGLIETNLANNGFGYVITEGLLAGLDTSAAGAAGDPVWLGTNGNLLYGAANEPFAPAHLVFIGIVTRKQSNNGEIFVYVRNGFSLREIHDVSITSVANNDLLIYEAATALWKNKTLAQIITAALGNGTSGQLLQTDGSGGFTWQNIPDASEIIKGLVNISAQIFSGIKTFTNGSNAGEIRLLEPSASGSNYVAIKSQAMGSDYSLTLPTTAGSSGAVLVTDGFGSLSWATNGGAIASQFIRNYTTGTVTGTAVQTIAQSVLIPANTFGVNQGFRVEVRCSRTNANAPGDMILGINSSISLSGIKSLGYATMGTGILGCTMTRGLSIKSATTTVYLAPVSFTDYTIGNPSISNIDWTQNQYFIVSFWNNLSTIFSNCLSIDIYPI